MSDDLPPGLSLHVADTPETALRDYLVNGIIEHHSAFLGTGTASPLAVWFQNNQGEPQGGLWGRSFHNWFFIELLFVPASKRGLGLGAKLLTATETHARTRGCTGVWLDTMNTQALAFYLHHGFESFGELPNYPNNTRRIFLRKQLP
jgi:ribosomal protein S18 acetylase RimI-like enzyme